MATVNMIRCEHCKAIMNPNWTACLVCGTESERDPGAVLVEAYRRYWELPESEPIERFQALHRDIDNFEQRVGEDIAWKILVAAARTWYEENRLCPFCKYPDVLHLTEVSR